MIGMAEPVLDGLEIVTGLEALPVGRYLVQGIMAEG